MAQQPPPSPDPPRSAPGATGGRVPPSGRPNRHPAHRSRIAAAALSAGALVGLVVGVAVAGSGDPAGAQDRSVRGPDGRAAPGPSDPSDPSIGGGLPPTDDGFRVPSSEQGGPSWGDPYGGSATPYPGGSSGGPVTRSGGS